MTVSDEPASGCAVNGFETENGLYASLRLSYEDAAVHLLRRRAAIAASSGHAGVNSSQSARSELVSARRDTLNTDVRFVRMRCGGRKHSTVESQRAQFVRGD